MSSGGGGLAGVFGVAPGGGLVVAGAGFQAAVQDADQAAGQPAESVVAGPPGGRVGGSVSR
jgi:hypothetical protein